MFKDANRYLVVDGSKLLKDTRNEYRFLSQEAYKGKTLADGTTVLPPGVKVTLQVLYDDSAPVLNRKTGAKRKIDNTFQVFDATILGAHFPLPYTPAETIVKLGGFDQEHSYIIDFNMILRFRTIEEIKKHDTDKR